MLSLHLSVHFSQAYHLRLSNISFSFYCPLFLWCIGCIHSFIMKCSMALLSSLLLVTSAVAAPRSKKGLAGRLQRRGRTLQGSTVRSKESKNSKTKFNAATGNTSDVEYSENWSGAAITSPPS